MKRNAITYGMRIEYARKHFEKYFKSVNGYTEFQTLRKFGTRRDKDILDLCYNIFFSMFLSGYLFAKYFDKELKKELTQTTDQVQE